MSEKDVIKDTRLRMDTVIEDLTKAGDRTYRTRRCQSADSVLADYYGTMTPLNQMASVHAPEPAMLTVQPWINVAPIESNPGCQLGLSFKRRQVCQNLFCH